MANRPVEAFWMARTEHRLMATTTMSSWHSAIEEQTISVDISILKDVMLDPKFRNAFIVLMGRNVDIVSFFGAAPVARHCLERRPSPSLFRAAPPPYNTKSRAPGSYTAFI